MAGQSRDNALDHVVVVVGWCLPRSNPGIPGASPLAEGIG
jgi:hypothetical protein